MTQVDDFLRAGREAAGRHAWRDAYELLGQADAATELGAEDLERWAGRLEAAIGLRERAYSAFVERGQRRRAAMLAVWLSLDHFTRAALSVSGGWLAHAERLLAGEAEGVEQGHVALVRGDRSQTKGRRAMTGCDMPTVSVGHNRGKEEMSNG